MTATQTVAHAFAPGHISTFFHPVRLETALKTGSLGGGFSVDKGAWAAVKIAEAQSITFAGVPTDAPITTRALEILAPGKKFRVEIRHELPLGAGFGMSAAGSLSACLAAAHLLGLDPNHALHAAHEAEVELAGGLGDAIGSWFGSGELRIRAGCPPEGWAVNVAPTKRPILFLSRGTISTKVILASKDLASLTSWVPEEVQRILKAGRESAFGAILNAGRKCTDDLRLLSPEVRGFAETLKDCTWGQIMLGDGIWIDGESTILESIASQAPKEWSQFLMSVDPNGARVTKGIIPLKS